MEGAAEQEIPRTRPAEAVARLLQRAGASRFGIAVSGGSDSMALLVAAREVLDRFDGYHAVCLHVDHGLRDASASDRQFVRSRAAAHAFPFAARSVVPKKRTASSSFEAAAREARYAALVEAARSHELEAILLGHHEDDRVETTALNLLRGSGVRGLKGLIAERRFETFPDVKFLRPFLSFKKAELLDYLTACRETFVVDATNDDTTLKRNRLRKLCLASESAETRRMRERLLAMADTAEELDRRAEAAAAEWIERHVVFAAQRATIAMSDLSQLPALFGHVVVRAVIERSRGERYVVKDRRFADFARWLTMPESPLPGDWGDGVRVRRSGPHVVFECGTADGF